MNGEGAGRATGFFRITVFVLVVLITASVVVFQASATHSSSNYRPCNTVYDEPEQIPETLNWSESFDLDKNEDNISYCLHNDTTTELLDSGYYGNATIFLQQRISEGMFSDRLHRIIKSDLHISNINYVAQGNVRNVNIEFDYYFPFYEDGSRCPNETLQMVLVGNQIANFSKGSGNFDPAQYQLDATQIQCGEWMHFSQSIQDFSVPQESSFSQSSTNIGAISFEMSNVYIKNVTISGQNSLRVW